MKSQATTLRENTQLRQEIRQLKRAINILLEYFDYIPETEQPSVFKRLKKEQINLLTHNKEELKNE